MKRKARNNDIICFEKLPGTAKVQKLLSEMSYPDDVQRLLLMDYVNMGFSDVNDFRKYVQSERVREEYEKLSLEDDSMPSSEKQFKDITELLDRKDYYGVEALINKKISSSPANGFLRLLKIISSLKGKNPAVLSCGEIKIILEALISLSQNEKCGVSAAIIHNAIVLIFKQANGVEFKLMNPINNFDYTLEDTVFMINYLNIPESIIKKSLKSLEK